MSKRHRKDFDIDFLDDLMPDGPELLSKTQPKITITEDFSMSLAERFCDALEGVKKFRTDIVVIEINSLGGDVFGLMKILNAMDTSGFKFATYCPSMAYSAGAEVLSSGTKGMRFMSPLSSAMIHPMTTGIGMETIADVTGQAEHFKEINEMLMDRLAKNMGITTARLNKMIASKDGTTKWLTPKAAKECKLIDIVGYPVFSENLTLQAITA